MPLVARTFYFRQVVETISYSYDAQSQLISIQDSVSSYSYLYDLNGRIIQIDNRGVNNRVVLNYSYDDVGNLIQTSKTIEGSTGNNTSIINYSRDALNRVTSRGGFANPPLLKREVV